jgi:dTDP-glucose 4,6-dehydratase
VKRTIIGAVGATEDLIGFVEDRHGHNLRYALETEKIKALGWEPS